MRHSDPHEIRKDFIEAEMLADRNPPRIMHFVPNMNVSNYKTPEEKKLADALADSALKTLRILELEKELAGARKDKERLDWMDTTAFTAYRLRDAEDGNLCLHCTVVNEDLPKRVGNVGPWIRDAIDAAMTSRQQ